MENFTESTQALFAQAISIAHRHQHGNLHPLHLLAAILEQPDSVAHVLLNQAIKGEVADGADKPSKLELRRQLETHLQGLPQVKGNSATDMQLAPATRQVLNRAQELAAQMQDQFLATEHILVALAQVDSAAAAILATYGWPKLDEALLEKIRQIRGYRQVETANPESTQEALEKYGTDMTQLAREGKLDPVIGRDMEIRRLVQVLSRRTKNNPVLIGEPGVGKTAVVEGLAQRIVNGDVPQTLLGKRLISLDIAQMVAGAKYRGEFEERLKQVLAQIKESAGQIITFIDELHTVVGAGAGADGSMDAANMLKPMLARGELRLVGATTLDEYRQYIEKDPALERRFAQVYVAEPSVEDTVAILRGIAPKYEAHHQISISDSALVAAAQLSSRYISGRQLPDKAIDVIDEAAAHLRMELDSSPEEVDARRRVVERLKMEESYLKNSLQQMPDEPAAVERLAKLQLELADAQAKLDVLLAQWEAEKSAHNRVGDLKAQLDSLVTQAERAEREGRWEEAGRLRYGEIPQIEMQVEAALADTVDSGNSADLASSHSEPLVSQRVEAAEIAQVIENWTGIPVGKLLQSQSERLVHLEAELHQRLIGQDRAVSAVANAVRRARAGIADPDRPTGAFLFLGPTGVGKTEIAKALAQFLFDDERALIRIDMSEYAEKHSVARLIGAPPGYVGYEAGGQLTEAVRRRPYSVILLDEMEKAHPEVSDVLLQVLDEGRLTDGQGRTVDMRNTILILTSNLGSQIMLDDTLSVAEQEQKVTQVVRQAYKPEFLNRLDEMIFFQPLQPAQLEEIVDLQLQRLANRVAEQDIHLQFAPQLRSHFAQVGFDPIFGARPLKRLLQQELGDRLALEILDGKIKTGQTVEVYLQADTDTGVTQVEFKVR